MHLHSTMEATATRLEDLTPGASVGGLAGEDPVTVEAVTWYGTNALNVVYRDGRGRVSDQVLYRDDEARLAIATAGAPWSLDADGALLRLVSEAQRIHWAHLFDPYVAVSTSLVDPLPHQITAVYEEMLPRLPLRFLLADDPGAGKTIMTGLLIKELVIRGDLQRCLIVCPGSLVEQWQDELYEKFGLPFDILTRGVAETARSGNIFIERDLLIARVDQLARGEDLRAQLDQTDWDLIVVDEAHKMSATYFGKEAKYTQRFHLGRQLSGLTRNFLLLTATPHNGKEQDFQLFLSLLDADRFEGRYRESVHQTDASDLMRRMVKEQLVTFEGTPLFPERRAETVSFTLSPEEAQLYEAVTAYVREEFNRADALLEGKRRGTVGFALTILQRRLASSPEAIYQSLKRRRERLEANLKEAQLTHRVLSWGEGVGDLNEDEIELLEEGLADDLDETEDALVDQATAAQTVEELEKEIQTLQTLEVLAADVRQRNGDAKWTALSKLLQSESMFIETPTGRRRRKLLIFTEHRDTLEYLLRQIRRTLGRHEAVVTIHGGVRRDDRRAVQEAFREDPEVSVLVATDAAGEGVNLQRAHLMINYDLPWNPNRLEQRFGRIHRIGQTEVCYCWNLLADETREGDVYQTLLKKLEQETKSLGGQVFDVLGKAIPGQELKRLMMEAVRHNNDPEVRARLKQKVEGALDHDRLKALMEEQALARDVLSPEQVFAVKEEMERAQARRLQPHYIGTFFREAFARLGGTCHEREPGRYELTHVPAPVRQRARELAVRDHVTPRYERVCFEKAHVVVDGRPKATLVAPGHPLLDAVVDLVLERYRPLMKQGAVLVDESDDGTTPRALVYLEHGVTEGGDAERLASRRFQFVEIEIPETGVLGDARDAGPAPYLDYRPLTDEEREAVADVMETARSADLDGAAIRYAIEHLVPQHVRSVRSVRAPQVAKAEKAVRERLTKEIIHWDHRAQELQAKEAAGKPAAKMNSQKARRRADDLESRLKARLDDLARQKHVAARTPAVLGGALVLPGGLVRARAMPVKAEQTGERPVDYGPKQTERVERVAVDAVMAAERALGNTPKDVGLEKRGYDMESRRPDGEARHLEVKGRIVGGDTVTVTRNEVLTALNEPERWIFALVEVPTAEAMMDGAEPEVRYVRRPPFREPSFAEVDVRLKWGDVWALGTNPLHDSGAADA